MISPFTKPGTKVVCIDNSDALVTFGMSGPFASDVLHVGKVYTILEWLEAPNGALNIFLLEVPHRGSGDFGFNRARFRLAELPRVLTDILTAVPIVMRERENVK